MPSAEVSSEANTRRQPSHDEDELVRRAQLGSTAAFEQLVVRRGPQLFRFLAVRLGDDADARDALQETLTAAWQSLPALRDRRRFWAWLVGIAAHKAADTARGRPDGRDLRRAAADRPSEALALGDDVGRKVAVRDALAGLPEAFRQVLLLRYVLQLSEEETASALGIRVGTVKSRCARARRALEERLP